MESRAALSQRGPGASIPPMNLGALMIRLYDHTAAEQLPVEDSQVGTLTVRDVIDWYERHEIREFAPVALKERQRIWQLFLAEYGDLALADAKPMHLLAFIKDQTGIRSNWTRRRFRATVNTPFNVAAQTGFIV